VRGEETSRPVHAWRRRVLHVAQEAHLHDVVVKRRPRLHCVVLHREVTLVGTAGCNRCSYCFGQGLCGDSEAIRGELKLAAGVDARSKIGAVAIGRDAAHQAEQQRSHGQGRVIVGGVRASPRVEVVCRAASLARYTGPYLGKLYCVGFC